MKSDDEDGIRVIPGGRVEKHLPTLEGTGEIIVEYGCKPGLVGLRVGLLQAGAENWLTPMLPLTIPQAEDMRTRLAEIIQRARERQS